MAVMALLRSRDRPGSQDTSTGAGGWGPGGGAAVAGHGGVINGEGHGSASRSGSGSRVRAGPASRSSAREGGWPGRQPRSWGLMYRPRTPGGAATGRGTAGRRVLGGFRDVPGLPPAGAGMRGLAGRRRAGSPGFGGWRHWPAVRSAAGWARRSGAGLLAPGSGGGLGGLSMWLAIWSKASASLMLTGRRGTTGRGSRGTSRRGSACRRRRIRTQRR